MALSVVAEKEPRTKVKEVEFATLWSDGSITVKCVRISHPHFVKPYKEGGKFSGTGLMPKKQMYVPAKDIIKAEIDKVIVAQKLPGMPPDRKFLRNGDDRPDRPDWLGHFTVSASEDRRPALRDARMQPVSVDDAAKLFYGGCWVTMLIRPWYQNNVEFGKRVNANLLGVQFVPISFVRKFLPDASDEPFGTGRISDDAIDESFGAIDDDDSGYDDGSGDGSGDADGL